MKIRFQGDEDFNQAIISGLRRLEPSIDFQTAEIAGLRGLPDFDVLTHAAQEERVLVSHDRRTMPIHFAEFIQTQASSGLIIIAQNVSIRNAIDALLLHWAATEAEESKNRIVDLPY